MLDPRDLANVAISSQRGRELIQRHYFIRKYGYDANIEINLPVHSNEINIKYVPAAGTGGSSITIGIGLDPLMIILDTFCSAFGHLTIKSSRSGEIMTKISRHVNDHCSNVPQKMILALSRYMPNFIFENVTNVELKNVNVLTYHNRNPVKINRMFPRLEELKVDDDPRFDQHFPHLQHFEFDRVYRGQINLAPLAAYNPQISSIRMTVYWPSLDHLRKINTLFPNVEILDVKLLRSTDKSPQTGLMETIRFQKLKQFTLDVMYFDEFDHEVNNNWIGLQLDFIVINHLESFTLLNKNRPLIPRMIDWILRNQELKSVHFEATSVSYDQMRRFIDELPELREMTFDCRYGDQIVDITRIMTEANQLQRISILVNENEERPEYQGMIAQSFDGWTPKSEKFVFRHSWNSYRSIAFERS